MPDKILNLLTNCKNVTDFSEAALDDNVTRQLDIYFSWRRLMFTQGYINKKRVFVSCTRIDDRDINLRLFNTINAGHFFKSSDTVREALESIGYRGSDLYGMCKLTIPDVTAENCIIDGCIRLDFADVGTKLTANVFAEIVPSLYYNLCDLSKQLEKTTDILHDLDADAQKLNELNELAETADLNVFNEIYSSACEIVDKWQPYNYLLLSKHGVVRDAYQNIMVNYLASDTMRTTFVSNNCSGVTA